MTDFERFTAFDSLYEAHRLSRKGKRWKDSVAGYDLRALEATANLRDQLRAGDYRISRYHAFRVTERGKPRTIKSTKYRDRVVLRSLCDNVLTPRIAPMFIRSNGASQDGKGTDFTRLCLVDDLRDYVNKHGKTGYILAGDFSKFFDSIPHDVLNARYARRLDDERVLELLAAIHASVPGNKGLPLGNQTSQIGALLILSDLDHYVKERLHIKRYARYMDDFYLIHESKARLRECLAEIERMAAELGLKLNAKKTYITTIQNGITFLGFRFFVSKTGKVVIKAAKGKAARERRILKKLREKLDAGLMTYDHVQRSYQGWRAGVAPRKARAGKRRFKPNTFGLVRKMDLFYYGLFDPYLTDAERGAWDNLKGENACPN